MAANRALGQLALTSAFTVPYMAGGLEATMGLVASNVYEATHRITTVAASTGLASLLIEAGLTVAVGASMRRAPKAARELQERKFAEAERQTAIDPPAAQSRLKRAAKRITKPAASAVETTATALAAGSPGIMLRSFVRNPELSVKAHKRKGYQTAGILAGVNTAAGAAAALTLDMMPTGVSDTAIEYVSDPKTWAALLITMGGAKAISKARATRKAALHAEKAAKPYDAVREDLAAIDDSLRTIHQMRYGESDVPAAPAPNGNYAPIQQDLDAGDAILRRLHAMPPKQPNRQPQIAPEAAAEQAIAPDKPIREPAQTNPYEPFARYHNTIGEPLLPSEPDTHIPPFHSAPDSPDANTPAATPIELTATPTEDLRRWRRIETRQHLVGAAAHHKPYAFDALSRRMG
jgi:hypothetical protein